MLLSWNCISEYQNAGFNLYRRVLHGGDWAQVNRALIPGRITNPDFKAYSYYDWAAPGVYEYKLETVSIKGVYDAYPILAYGTGSSSCSEALTSEGFEAAASSVAFYSELHRAETFLHRLSG